MKKSKMDITSKDNTRLSCHIHWYYTAQWKHIILSYPTLHTKRGDRDIQFVGGT